MRGDDDFFEGLTSARSSRGMPVDAGSGSQLTGRLPGHERSMYVHWFLEDVARSLPYGRGFDEGFQIAVTPKSPAIEELVLNAMPAQFYGPTGLAEAFRGFLVPATFDLLRGKLYLEIEYFYRGCVPDGKPVAFKIHILPLDSVSKRFGKYRQAVELQTDGVDKARGWVREPLDSKRLVVVSLPSPWARQTSRMLTLLSEVSSQTSVATDFLTGEHGPNSGFDYTAHNEMINNLVLKQTRAIGWTGRDTFLEGMLDPEKAWRAIQFARFQSVVRDAVLNGLQEAVDKAGLAIGFSARLVLSGVLDSSDLDHLETELQSGTRRILELIHPGLRSPSSPDRDVTEIGGEA